jgi:hypothetical protein
VCVFSYQGADKSLARPTSRCILFDSERISFDASLVLYIYIYIVLIKKGKAVLLQAWSGPECSRKLRFPDFMTTAQDGGKVVILMHRPPLSPGNTPGTHFC